MKYRKNRKNTDARKNCYNPKIEKQILYRNAYEQHKSGKQCRP